MQSNTSEYLPSTRAQVITRRTYNRPINETGDFESWSQTINRVIDHQRWLWTRASKQINLTEEQEAELETLRNLYLNRIGMCSGRTLWLGGTEVAKRREASQFNCSFFTVQNVYDVVDGYWLLLQGCGVGFKAETGVLNGFSNYISDIEIVRRKPEEKFSRTFNSDRNEEFMYDKHYYLRIGDSAESWAKAVGKLLVMKHKVDKITIDFTKIRPAGERLKGYGWISSGDESLCKALLNICGILNKRVEKLLDEIDILDIMNHLGMTLSSRRSAEICLMDYHNQKWREFATAKKEHWIENPQRSQSNNSIMFWSKPSREQLQEVFDLMVESGGSEPGFINAEHAKKRGDYFKGVNPCGEIILGNKSFCNLSEIDVSKFNGKSEEYIESVVKTIARANYRQTCVNLDDGVLQRSWHELNEFLRLTGIGLTGIVCWEHVDNPEMFRKLKQWAREGVDSMADELNLQKSKNVTTVKPSGTLSKIMDCTEGVHKPLGKYIFNNIRFSIHDPLVEKLKKANYYSFQDPYSSDSIIIRFPVCYENVKFDIVNGKEVNAETALSQLSRYKMLMENYVDHNCSITVSYSVDEIPLILDWFMENWDCYIGVSFIYRNDASKTAADLGYPYLPIECTTKEGYETYLSTLLPINLDENIDHKYKDFEIFAGTECTGNFCPVK
jgi:adenosylcobalamin-dependent ribonucleoside-triphosphate reductase